jgi:hypothetical protein
MASPYFDCDVKTDWSNMLPYTSRPLPYSGGGEATYHWSSGTETPPLIRNVIQAARPSDISEITSQTWLEMPPGPERHMARIDSTTTTTNASKLITGKYLVYQWFDGHPLGNRVMEPTGFVLTGLV